ncbi:MAG: stage II sporulation protein M [Limnochordia bacterium]|jgi:stage II sporulation protein M|nr:stage II sporulation protein M [Bacillota bacterium]NLL07714.1 stage II sporulation protein M [Bacillota bacterium]HBG08691.1 stage II sporulation protein M [Bacillota bacterium]
MFLAGALWELIIKYFWRHLPVYVALMLLFMTGLGFGALATQKLSPVQKEDLSSYISAVYASLAENNQEREDRAQVFYQSLKDNVIKTAGLLFLLGLTVIGAPLILAVVFVRGFVLGFTVGFLVQDAMVKGLVLSTTCVLPHNILMVPALLLGAGGALSFAGSAFRTLVGRSRESVQGQLATTTLLALCSGLLFLVAALVETYITPILVQLGRGFLT